MKKIIYGVLSLCFFISLNGCSKENIDFKEIIEKNGFEISYDSDSFNYSISDTRNVKGNKFNITAMFLDKELVGLSGDLLKSSSSTSETNVNGSYYDYDENKARVVSYAGGIKECVYYFDDEFDTGCSESDIELANSSKKQFESFLEKIDMTYEKFYDAFEKYASDSTQDN